MILIELTAAIDAAGTLETFRVADAGFATAPTDTPANADFDPCILDPGDFGLFAFSDGRTGGRSKLEQGAIVLANTDGHLDDWVNHGFDGRPVVVRSGTDGAYPGSFPVILAGAVESVSAGLRQLTVQIRDKAFILDKPLLTTRYAGSNALPNGVEGTSDDLKGKVKPRVYGKVTNIPPPCVNTAKLTYQVSDGAVDSFDGVYDRGVALTAGADHATIAALQAAVVAAATYQTCKAEGLLRLGSAPAGEVTCDVTQGASAAARTAAQLLKAVALAAGVPSGEIDAADVTALDVANPAVLGIWINDEATAASVMDDLAASVAAYYAFDRPGDLRMGRLVAPAGSPVATIHDYEILNIERRPPRDNGRPVWSVTVSHSKIWTVQGNDLAGGVAADRRAYLALERRAETATDPSVKTQFLLAGEMTVETLLTSSADAATEAARLLAIHKVRRDVFDVTVPAEFLGENPNLKLMDVVRVQHGRFGLAAGRDLVWLGLRSELASNRLTLTVWG